MENREIVVEHFDLGRLFEQATINKIYVKGLYLHEIKNEIIIDYEGVFEMIGSMLISEMKQKTIIKFKNGDDFETYVNAKVNGGFDSEDVTFTGWLYQSNSPDFNKINRCQYGRGTGFKKDIVDYIGNNCSSPTSGNCCIECINFFT